MYKGGTYLALGDSITAGSQLSPSQQYGTYAAQIQQAILQNYSKSKLINKAISGWKSADFLSSPYYWAKNDVDLVSLHIGTNDCSSSISLATFQSNLENIVNVVKKFNPNAEIILCSISRRADSITPAQLDPYRSVVSTVATGKSTYLCRFEDAWAQANTATYTAVDLLHPNYAGHQLLFNQLWPVIQQTNFVKNLGH